MPYELKKSTINLDDYDEMFNRDGTITLVPIKKEVKLWRPEKGGGSFYVAVDHTTEYGRGEYTDDYYNIYRTPADAEYAAPVINRTHAIISACRQVDPEFVPDWGDFNQLKWFPSFEERWVPIKVCLARGYSPAFVSSEEKAQQVIELLKPLNLFGELK